MSEQDKQPNPAPPAELWMIARCGGTNWLSVAFQTEDEARYHINATRLNDDWRPVCVLPCPECERRRTEDERVARRIAELEAKLADHITPRDLFAAAAITGLLQRGNLTDADQVVEKACMIADRMLAERERRARE